MISIDEVAALILRMVEDRKALELKLKEANDEIVRLHAVAKGKVGDPT